MHHHYGVQTIKVSHDGLTVASADNNKAITLWKADSREVITEEFNFHVCKVFEVCWSSDDKFLLSVGLDNSAIYWNIAEKKRQRTFTVLDSEIAVTCSFFGNDKTFVVGGSYCSPKVISVEDAPKKK